MMNQLDYKVGQIVLESFWGSLFHIWFRISMVSFAHNCVNIIQRKKDWLVICTLFALKPHLFFCHLFEKWFTMLKDRELKVSGKRNSFLIQYFRLDKRELICISCLQINYTLAISTLVVLKVQLFGIVLIIKPCPYIFL